MYGWRARLGILVPSRIISVEPEFQMMIPKGVSCHYHRYPFHGGKNNEEDVQQLKEASEFVGDAAEIITHVSPSAVVMTGTAISFIGGYGYDQMLIKKMKERNGNLPTTTTSTSVIDAFRKLRITKVSVASPYVEELAMQTNKFVEDSGVKVLNAGWLNKTAVEIPSVSKEAIYHLAMEVDHPESEAVFISCVNLDTVELIETLERNLHKPVITSNQATVWNVLRLANINDEIHGFGQLMLE
jgi:maleate isomerase